MVTKPDKHRDGYTVSSTVYPVNNRKVIGSRKGSLEQRLAFFVMQIKSDYFGKSCEHNIFGELLKHNLDVFTTIVDNKGIDCVIRKNKHEYLEIQVKGRQKRNIFNIGKFSPRKNYFFIFITLDEKIYTLSSHVVRGLVDKRWKLRFPVGASKKIAAFEQYKYKKGQHFKKLLHF